MEHPVNPPVKTYWDAFNWAMMNVTTVGSNIFGVTKIGQSLAVLLAASGMIFFPIFTAYVTTKFQNKRKGTENN
jgi:voltage-gated potassium channel